MAITVVAVAIVAVVAVAEGMRGAYFSDFTLILNYAIASDR